MRPYRNYCSFFYVKKYFVSKRGDVKTDGIIDKPGTLFFWDEKICLFYWNEHDTYDYYKSTATVV